MSKLVWVDEKIIEYIEEKGYKFIRFINEKDGKIYNKKGNERKIEIWCGNPNHKPYDVKFANFKNGQRCRKCADEENSIKFSLDYEYVKNYIESFGFELLSKEYINYDEEIKILCPNHGIYKTTFHLFKIAKYKCPKCANEHRGEYNKLTYEYIKNYIELFNYKLLTTEYINAKQQLSVQCFCGHKPYNVSFDRFQRGDRCPYCNQSKGEDRIEEVLRCNNINYLIQYRFENCKLYKPLPFDFYLPQYDVCIEFDGRQHFEIIDYFNGLDGFIDRKIRDTIKNIYCQQNNIKLIRIPYWDFDNIEDILNQFIK